MDGDTKAKTKTHKRKRSLQDTPVDLSKMRMALNRLDALKEELDGIQETEEEMGAVMAHVAALEEILSSAKRPKISFSSLKKEDLAKLGIMRKRLAFLPDRVADLTQRLNTKTMDEISLLRDRILEIYGRVNMDYEPGSRMILDAVLLTLGRIAYDELSKLDVAILPEMKITSGDGSGVQVVNPVSGYEVWLTGSVDYAVIRYKDELDNKDRLIGMGGSRDDAFELSEGRLFLVGAKRQYNDGSALASSIPEAIGQALALSQSTGRTDVRFCLSNGHTWIFCLLKYEGAQWTYYESGPRQLSKENIVLSNKALCEIIQLTFEWLVPLTANLYTLSQ